jgi:hypothetical protein
MGGPDNLLSGSRSDKRPMARAGLVLKSRSRRSLLWLRHPDNKLSGPVCL